MTCPSCTRHVEDALLAVPGVTRAAVDYPSNKAQVTGNRLDVSALVAAVGPLVTVLRLQTNLKARAQC
jgi:mercuric reductase